MTTALIFQNCLVTDRMHTSAISRYSQLAIKQARSKSGKVVVCPVGNSKSLTQMTALADKVEELIKDPQTDWSKYFSENFDKTDKLMFGYRVGETNRWAVLDSEGKTDLHSESIMAAGTGAALAEFLAVMQYDAGLCDPKALIKRVSKHDQFTSDSFDVTYGAELVEFSEEAA